MGQQRRNQETRGKETRGRILQVAAEAFAENGFDATGVSEICRRAGVSKGAFYHHFPSKHDVFLALLNDWLAGLEVQLTTARAGAATVPEELLRMAALARLVFVVAEEQLPMFLEFWARASRDAQAWQATIAPYRQYRDFFAQMIEAGVAEGSLRPVAPKPAAYTIVGLALGLILQGLLDPQGEDWGEMIEEGMGMLLKGLEKQ